MTYDIMQCAYPPCPSITEMDMRNTHTCWADRSSHILAEGLLMEFGVAGGAAFPWLVAWLVDAPVTGDGQQDDSIGEELA